MLDENTTEEEKVELCVLCMCYVVDRTKIQKYGEA